MPIIAASFCPHPPLLIPEVASGAAAELDDLRSACLSSIQGATADCDAVVVIGTDAEARRFNGPALGTMAGYGVSDLAFCAVLGEGDEFGLSGSDAQLPLSLTVGAWLLRSAGWKGPQRGIAVAPGTPPGGPIGAGLLPDDQRIALLVMGDGAPSRSVQAPGYLDERAAPFDASVAVALASGDPAALAALDWDLAVALGVAGGPAWRYAAALLAGTTWTAQLRYDAAPYGVGYFVADWQSNPTPRPAP